jgi:hypothetical protein
LVIFGQSATAYPLTTPADWFRQLTPDLLDSTVAVDAGEGQVVELLHR